jgi:hypothetical protein
MTETIFYATAERAHANHQTDAPVVAIKLNESGFYPIYTYATAAQLNEVFGWTDDVIDAAIAGSMFGWHVPAAKKAVEAAASRRMK